MREILIGLDTVYDGGSLSVFEDGREIDFINFSERTGKSENILPALEEVLARNALKKREIKEIRILGGAGSVTGKRISQAIGLGLKNALKVKVRFIQISELFSGIGDSAKKRVFAFEAKKNRVFWLAYDSPLEKNHEIKQGNAEDFIEYINQISCKNAALYLTPKLNEEISVHKNSHLLKEKDLEIIILKSNFSSYLNNNQKRV